jgi:SAM-dependent methyltransferase/UDP-N-acetylglucosamine transferase subunit ALG13
MGARLRIFVTVGMSDWPFDRLMHALAPLCTDHDVFAQTGGSAVLPPCPNASYLGFDEAQRRIDEADVVITHAGNTVRLVQRAGKVPIVVAREPERGEIRNGHQVLYTERPDALGPAVVVSGDLGDLAEAVRRHHEVEQRLLASLPPRTADPERAAATLDRVVALTGRRGRVGREAANPFRDDPIRRYAWAWSQLAGRTGRHLEVGIGEGAPFLGPLTATTALTTVGIDAHPGYLAEARVAGPSARLVRTEGGGRLPFPAAAFDSASMLDVLEHVADEDATLAEVHRVLRPGAVLVLTVPARHAFSFLDPDNAKLRLPRLHRVVYTARYGSARYTERFLDDTDGFRGDLAWDRTEHTNYRAGDLIERLHDHGFEVRWRDGANLFGRLVHAARLLLPGPLGRVLDPVMAADGLAFHHANLFLLAERR